MIKDKFSILIITHDENLAQNLKSKIKSHYHQFPIEVTLQSDGKQGLFYFEHHHPPMIMISDAIPGMNVAQFLQQIRRLDGAVFVVYLENEEKKQEEIGQDESSHLDNRIIKIPLPILNWSDIFSLVYQAIPDDLKGEFGLERKDSIKLQKIQSFSEKNYKIISKDEFSSPKPIHFIPSHFDADPQNSSDHKEIEAGPNTTSSNRDYTDFSDLNDLKKKRYLLELVILFILSGVTFVLILKTPEQNWAKYLKYFFIAITSFSYLGFFATLTIRQIIIRDR